MADIKDGDDDSFNINCLIIKDESKRGLCDDLKEELGKETITLEEFSEGLFRVLEENEDEFLAVFTEENGEKDE